MAAIKGKNTTPEIYIRHELFRKGYRYRNNVKNIIGHPDVYMAKYKTAIFVNGCFWHRHKGCRYCYMPKSRVDYWTNKFQKNIARDKLVRQELAAQKIKCIVLWECTIKKMRKNQDFNNTIIAKIEFFLNNNDLFLEL